MKGKIIALLIGMILVVPMVSAGVGIKWGRESLLVSQGQEACLTYSVYNPWPDDSYVKIGLSGELNDILQYQESEAQLIPANTGSGEAIPLEFCFQVPFVYDEGRDCLVGDTVGCEQVCGDPQRVYSGEIVVTEEAGPLVVTGSGGSSAFVSVSAPLNIKVSCEAHSRDYSFVYVAVALVALVFLVIAVAKKQQ